MAKYDTHEYDVIVIGAGGAGLRAAIEASAKGCKTAIICKSLLGKAHTVMAEGGVAAAMGNLDDKDGWETHFCDTIRGGKYLNNWRMAEIHAKESPDRIRELEEWGAVFDRTAEGKINQRAFGGHTWRRLCHVGDRTGLELIRTLQDKGVHSGIDVYMECTVSQLFKNGTNVVGALAYWRDTGDFTLFKGKSFIICTGGLGRSFEVTSNSWECTGDGIGLAYEAGAELLDSEFVQFHPTGMVWPSGVQGLLVTEAVRGEGGLLHNSKGERIMEKYDPERMELSTRDVVAKAIYTEVKEGRGTEHGGMYLDISHRDADYIKAKLPSMYMQFMELADVDITKGPMEVGPTTHYTMGGIRVEPETGATRVPGLYAAGEAAGGMHGANRLGGNSLSDLLVFGRRAGLAAAEHAQGITNAPSIGEDRVEAGIKAALEPFTVEGGEDPYAIHRELQISMQANIGIMRTEDDLVKGIAVIEGLKKRLRSAKAAGPRAFNPGWHLALELRSMLVISEAIARCALQRTESRGAHTRLDYPETDTETWAKINSVVSKDGDQMKVGKEPLPQMPDELKQLLEEK